MAKSTKKKKNKGSDGKALQFLIWHGEKIVVGILVVVALWFAAGTLSYRSVKWSPDELEKIAKDTEDTIRQSRRTASDEKIEFFDYAAHADQVKEPISAAPYYRTDRLWNPQIK